MAAVLRHVGCTNVGCKEFSRKNLNAIGYRVVPPLGAAVSAARFHQVRTASLIAQYGMAEAK